jgi:catechol 2,3-dioxygenase-like lactoylglutathione lyase family enzyme
MIRGVKLATVPVTDQDRAIAFYTEKLGFRILTDQPFNDEQRWVELGIDGAETRVVLFKFDNGLKPGSQMNFTFWTDDVEGTARELKVRGVKFISEPKRESWGISAIFQDPDGNSFVLGSG